LTSGPCPGAFEGGIDGEVPAANGLVDDGANFPGPGVVGVDRALIANFGGEADADRPVPGFGYADARADVVADPLDAVAVLFAGEDIETHFRPAVYALGEFERLVFLMVGRIHAIDGVRPAFRGEVGVQLHHQVVRGHRIGTVNLDLVIGLG
jgi:hypothetical protein